MSAGGTVVVALSLPEVESAARELASRGADALAICFLHSYRNPEHERLARDVVQKALPGMYVCASSDVWSQQKEFERATVAVMNAFIGRKLDSYFTNLAAIAKGVGIEATPLTTRSNGGVMTSESARRAPVLTLLSGPAAGVVGALFVGRRSGHERLIALDMGGTSAEAAVIDGRILYSTESSVAGHPVVMPAVDISSIGAGGGSVVWLDSMGVLKVGPMSAGAAPGPACYGGGGIEPTLTDAYVELGLVNPEAFLGGRLHLDPELAHQALASVGRRSGLSAEQVAAGAVDVATSNMVAQLMPLMARKGVDPRDFALIAYGGAGPTHALILAREIGIRRLVIPASPGTLSALGCLVADVKHDAIKTIYKSLSDIPSELIETEYRHLEGACSAWLAAQRVPVEEVVLVRSADMRYTGQSFEVEVMIPHDRKAGKEPFRRLFDSAHERAYGFADEAAPVEVVNLRVTVIGVTAKPAGRHRFSSESYVSAAPLQRRVTDPRGPVMATVLTRLSMVEHQTCTGPIIIEADDTTVYIPAGYKGVVDAFGSLIIEEEPHED
jgi:N-methylhydantoinase A